MVARVLTALMSVESAKVAPFSAARVVRVVVMLVALAAQLNSAVLTGRDFAGDVAVVPERDGVGIEETKVGCCDVACCFCC